MWSFRELPIGVELDVDLSRPMNERDQATFRELFFEKSLLVARGQRLSPERHTELCSYLGPIPSGGSADDRPAHVIALDGRLGADELVFHSDLAFDPEPFVGVSLHALDIDPLGGTSTEFVSGIDAYESLPQDLREEVEGREARHMFPLRTDRRADAPPPKDYPQAVHPVVWPHPVTGRRILYVNRQATTEIVDLDNDAGSRLLDALFEHIYRPDAVYAHRWRTGDVVFWDNRALQHARSTQRAVRKRTMQRVIIGRGTLGELYGGFLAERSDELRAVAHSAPGAKSGGI
jgi:taurine dioxygenase